VSVPVFQHLATIANHADNVCVVTFRPLRDDLVWNTRLAQLCQWHTRVFQRVSTLQPSQVPLKNVHCDFESLHDELVCQGSDGRTGVNHAGQKV
jgi:hypothetical protein